MNALSLGLVAALAWGVHDFLVRYVTQRSSVSAAMATVLLTGMILVAMIATIRGEFQLYSNSTLGVASASGIGFALGFLGLFKAYEIGPVRLVAPLIAAYPVLSVGWAAFSGTVITTSQWVSVLAVVVGIGIVTALSPNQESEGRRIHAIIWSLFGACGFAAAFSIGQHANLVGADFLVLTIIRTSALAFIVVFALTSRESILPDFRNLPILLLMGCLDALALGVVIAAAPFENPEYAAVAASTAGIVTIYFARMWLNESMSLGQWSGVLLSFCGIIYLAF